MSNLWFKFIHNVIAHPLLFFTCDAVWCVRLHDWSKRRMTQRYRKIDMPVFQDRNEVMGRARVVGHNPAIPYKGGGMCEWHHRPKSCYRPGHGHDHE